MSKSSTTEQTGAQALADAWFDAQLKLISDDPDAAQEAFDAMDRVNDMLRPLLEKKVGKTGAAHGVVVDFVTHQGGAAVDNSPRDETDGLTRNQRSKVRAVYLMEALAKGGPHHTLAALFAELRGYNFRDEQGNELTEAALRSHLFRMKDAGYVAIVSTGVYELTSDGFAHLQRERTAQQPLIERFCGSGR